MPFVQILPGETDANSPLNQTLFDKIRGNQDYFYLDRFGASGHNHNGSLPNGPQITNAGIANLAINDAKINDVSTSKITGVLPYNQLGFHHHVSFQGLAGAPSTVIGFGPPGTAAPLPGGWGILSIGTYYVSISAPSVPNVNCGIAIYIGGTWAYTVWQPGILISSPFVQSVAVPNGGNSLSFYKIGTWGAVAVTVTMTGALLRDTLDPSIGH
jgi:hypothetical protein